MSCYKSFLCYRFQARHRATISAGNLREVIVFRIQLFKSLMILVVPKS